MATRTLNPDKLDAEVLAYVVKCYDLWKQHQAIGCGRVEPRIGVVALVDEFFGNRSQTAAYEQYGIASRRMAYAALRSSVQRLVKAGKLEASFGAGPYGEERQYNPAPGVTP